MKYLVHISRLLVGVLFIISGLIKLNDPLGFSYKLQEYFSTEVLNMPFLEPYALAISVFVVVFEVVLGVFLLIGYKPKFTAWSLLLMIVFFTFLTFYSAYFDKVKDCGCFGDALKLTPWESFTKDIILLFFVLILFIGVKHIKPLFSKLPTTVFALLSFILCLWFGYHVLMHLPSKDFRAYKIGDNILENMKIPDDAPKAIQEFTWTFNVNGEEKEFVTNGSYPQVEGDYVGVKTKLIKEGYEPPILDFSIENENGDVTEEILQTENLIMIVSYNLDTAEKEGLAKIKAFSDEAIKKGYTVIGMTSSGDEAKQRIKNEYKLNFDFYLCDEKALKTVVRSNPGALEIDAGTVKQKKHWNDFEELILEELPNAKPNLDFDLKAELDEIYKLDQGVREIYFAQTKEDKDAIAESLNLPIQEEALGYMKIWNEVDSINLVKVEKIIKEHGYPGKSKVGEPTNETVWYVIQHSPKIAEYLPMIKEAAANGDLGKNLVAMMEDRYLMQTGKEQIYGTQGTTLGRDANNPINIIWPIKNSKDVNKLRVEVGFNETVESYGKRLYGDDFVFKNYTLKEVKLLDKDNTWIQGLLKDIN
ncbi:MAG: DoxX family protein [Bacteroidetes bacterium]|nr:MAG: DoxX family protein [Bacteroidota bacterium]